MVRPEGFPVDPGSVEIDPRVGGRMAFALVGDADPSMRTAFDGRFSAVVENQLLACSGASDGIPGQAVPWPSHLRVQVTSDDGGTWLLVVPCSAPLPPAPLVQRQHPILCRVADEIALSTEDVRAMTAYAAECAQDALEVFELAHPADSRPRDAVDAALAFARGGERGKRLRDTAWAALRAARDAGPTAAGDAARAAMAAASAAYLHPLANATQVKHILGAAAHAARAAELVAGDDRRVGNEHITQACRRASPAIIAVLRQYPAAPPGGGRVGELLRALDDCLRVRS